MSWVLSAQNAKKEKLPKRELKEERYFMAATNFQNVTLLSGINQPAKLAQSVILSWWKKASKLNVLIRSVNINWLKEDRILFSNFACYAELVEKRVKK